MTEIKASRRTLWTSREEFMMRLWELGELKGCETLELFEFLITQGWLPSGDDYGRELQDVTSDPPRYVRQARTFIAAGLLASDGMITEAGEDVDEVIGELPPVAATDWDSYLSEAEG